MVSGCISRDLSKRSSSPRTSASPRDAASSSSNCWN